MSTLTKLKKCPFCGSKPETIEGITCRGANSSGNIPSGATLIRKHESSDDPNDLDRYYWERKGYVITCSNNSCIGRSKRPRFDTVEQAIAAWNHRVEDWEY